MTWLLDRKEEKASEGGPYAPTLYWLIDCGVKFAGVIGMYHALRVVPLMEH
jgi:hypothetical protein